MTEAIYPDRPHLEKSRKLDWSVRARTETAQDAVRHLLSLLLDSEADRKRVRSADALARLERTMESMALDLFLAHDSARPFLSYSRGKADYVAGKTHPLVTLLSVTTVADYLERAGFAQAFGGSYARRDNPFGPGEIGKGYYSRLTATTALIELLKGVFDLGGQHIKGEDIARPLQLRAPPDARGNAKRLLSFKKTDETRRMSERVLRGNRLRAAAEITGPRKSGAGGTTALYRVFNNGDWRQGGRFYGGWWQNLPSERRSNIRINGEGVVELDFRTSQPRICFQIEGCPIPHDVDPYAVPSYDSAIYRNTVKETFGRLVNSEPGGPLNRSSEAKRLFKTAVDFRAFAKAVEEHFSPVAPWLRSGRGNELQWVESEITDEILHRLTDLVIPCLPIHDSFIVPLSAERVLAQVMTEAYGEVMARFTANLAYPAIAGWSSPVEEQHWREWIRAREE